MHVNLILTLVLCTLSYGSAATERAHNHAFFANKTMHHTDVLSCKDMYGKPVDWWVGYKQAGETPGLEQAGYTMAYFDAKTTANHGKPHLDWHWQTVESDENDRTALYHTVTQLPYMHGSDATGYIVYNDQRCECPRGEKCFQHKSGDGSMCPTAYHAINDRTGTPYVKCSCNFGGYPTPHDKNGKPYAHAKGMLLFDKHGGVLINHSTPGFPLNSVHYERVGWSWYKLGNAQHFYCATLDPAGVEEVAKQLSTAYVRPQEHSHHVPSYLHEQYPIASSLDADGYSGYRYRTETFESDIQTKGGLSMKLLGKEGGKHFRINLWEDLVAPRLDASLYTETWCNCGFEPKETSSSQKCRFDSKDCGQKGGEKGDCICNVPKQREAFCCQKSKCGSKHRVQQILAMDFSGTKVHRSPTSSIISHAKWSISQDKNDPWVCFGDINRQATQRGRGGGAVCNRSPEQWRVMNRFVAQYDFCHRRDSPMFMAADVADA
jgi:hypothetical protein